MSELLLANRYRVLEELGRGGMGVVYRVADTLKRDQVLALKAIRSERSLSPSMRLRFKAEFRTMAKLRHPNTVSVTDFGQLDERTHYFTMEYVEGQSLDAVLARGPLGVADAARYAVQLLRALQFIHARLFVHRDVKPANLRITPDGILKLMDFGLVQQLGMRVDGRFEGTVGYMSPEAMFGGVIDAGSDLYSAGCVMFEMLAGRPPFTGNAVPRRLRDLRPDVPPRLEAVVTRLLEKQLSRRYASAREAIDDISDVIEIGHAQESYEHKASYLITSSLVGRDHELDRLRRALGAATAGEGRSIFIGAPAGTGKSRLADELLLCAKLDGIVVLPARCIEDGTAPYEAVAQLLRPLIPVTAAESLATWGPALARGIPELTLRGIAAAPPLPANLEKERFRKAVLEWLRQSAREQPLLLVVDDLQWCDRPSLELLNACVRELRRERIFLLGTFRSDETPPSSAVWSTLGEGLTEHLSLGALELSQTAQLVEAMLPGLRPDDSFLGMLQQRTGGNPFFVTEALRYLIEEGVLVSSDGGWRLPGGPGRLALPGSVELLIRRRLERLSARARELAQVSAVAAVSASQLERAMLLSVSELAEEELFAGLDELVEHQLLDRDASGYTFAHDRMREVLYEDLPVPRRLELHQRCGEYLEAQAAAGEGVGVSALAHHFGRGCDPRRAFLYARRAADEARSAGQEGVALEWWERAARFLEAAELPDKRAQQFSLCWDLGTVGAIPTPVPAAAALEKCIGMLEEEAGREDWVKTRCEAYLWLCVANANNPKRGIPEVRRALELLPARGTPLEAAAHVALAACFYAAGRIDEMREAIQTAERLFEGTNPAAFDLAEAVGYVSRDFIASFVTLQGQRFDEALCRRCELLAEAFGEHSVLTGMWVAQAMWFALTGRHDEAMARLDDIARVNRRSGVSPTPLGEAVRALAHAQRGEWEEVLAVDRRAREFAATNDFTPAYLMLDVAVARALAELGRRGAGELERSLEDILERSRDQEIYLPAIQALIALGDLAARQQRWDVAQQRFDEAHALCARGIARNPLHQAIAARRLGDVALARSAGDDASRERALRRYEEALAIVRRPEQDNLIEQGRVQRALGEWHLAGGDAAAARQAFEAAARLFATLRNGNELRRVESLLLGIAGSDLPRASPAAVPHSPGRTLMATQADES